MNTKISSKIQTDKKLQHIDETKKAHIKNEKNMKNDKDKNVRENLTIIISPENLKAIQDHDADGAELAMSQHMQTILKRLMV